MIAIAYLFFFLVYILVSIGLAWVAAKLARAGGIKGWKLGVPVFVLLLGLMFWDWLPMEVVYRYQCTNHAGFKQFKTLNEWKQENPGVAETLTPISGVRSTFSGNRERYQLNQHFAWDIIRTRHPFHIVEKEERIVDVQNDEILAQYVDFMTDVPPLALGANKIRDYKFWLMKDSCVKTDQLEKWLINGDSFISIKKKFKNIGKEYK